MGCSGGVLLLVLDSSASSLRLSCRRLLACCRLCGGWLLLLRQGVFVSGALCFSFFCTRTSLHHTRIGLSFTRTLACAAFRQAWRSVHFPRGCRGRRWCICAAPERLPIVCAMLAPGLSVHESSRSGDDELDGFEARWEGDDHELDGFEPRQTEEMYLLPSWR